VAKNKGRPENLISIADRTTEEQREITSKGGKKSVAVRREKKMFSQIQAEFLAETFDIVFDEDDKAKRLTGEQLLKEVQRRILLRCDSASVSMIKEIREGKEGSKTILAGEDGNPPVLEVKIVRGTK
jgi:hypothetical protein